MLDRNNMSAYTDDHNGFDRPDHVHYGMPNILGAAASVGALTAMVSGPGACARPALYLLGWLILLAGGLVALAPLIALLPDECFNDDEEAEEEGRQCRR